MAIFKNSTVTGAELYLAAREVCSRLYVALGGSTGDAWIVQPHPSTAAISREFHQWSNRTVWTLSMPAMPMDARLTRKEADTVIAYVTHELGHALFTDFGAWARAVREGVSYLTNALEDVRIEMRLVNIGAGLPNGREQLETLTEYCTAKALAQDWNPGNPSSLAFSIYQYATTRADLLAYNVPSMPDFARECPADLLAFLDDIMTRLKACNTTADCVELALWIKGTMDTNRAPQETQGNETKTREDNEENEDGEENKKGTRAEQSEDAEGEDAEGRGEGEGEDEDAEGEDEDAEGEDEDAEGEGEGEGEDNEDESKGEGRGAPLASEGNETSEQTEDTKQAQQGGEGGGKGAWSDADMSDEGQRPTEPDLSDMGERISERMGRDPEQVARDNADVFEFLNTPPSMPRQSTRLAGFEGAGDKAASYLRTPAKLRRDLTRAVRSPEQLDTEHYQTRGRFDVRAFARVEAGAANVFRRRSEATGQTAAVSLLIDLSGSMAGVRAEMAACLAVHLGDALKAAAVPFEVAGFIEGGGNAHGIIMAKAFSDAWSLSRDKVGAMEFAAKGGTAMMPAIMAMTERMRRRSGVTRRVLLVLTDGADHFTIGANRAAIAAAEAKGVEVVGMGLKYDASDMFARYVQVNDLDTIADKGLGALLDVLGPQAPRALRAA